MYSDRETSKTVRPITTGPYSLTYIHFFSGFHINFESNIYIYLYNFFLSVGWLLSLCGYAMRLLYLYVVIYVVFVSRANFGWVFFSIFFAHINIYDEL